MNKIDKIYVYLIFLSMRNHFLRRPFATMTENPRGIVENGEVLDGSVFYNASRKRDVFSEDSVKWLLRINGPFMLALPLRFDMSNHWVMVFGCANGSIVYHDPLTNKNQMLSIEEFKRILPVLENGQSEKIDMILLRDNCRIKQF